jgi:hypothetical protein
MAQFGVSSSALAVLTAALAPLLSGSASVPAASQPMAAHARGVPPARSGVPLSPPTIPERLLAAHNLYRAQVGVPPLLWDAELAAGAAQYGPSLAAQRSLVHSPRATRPGIAENLWMGSAGAYTPEAMVASWGEERDQFRPGIFPNVSTTGNWLDVSHYTQMIWRGTTKVGCAVHRSGGWDYLICRYTPKGNRDGQHVP